MNGRAIPSDGAVCPTGAIGQTHRSNKYVPTER